MHLRKEIAMKFDFLINAIDKLLRINDEDKNADMHLPAKVPYFGVAMIFAGLLIAAVSIFSLAFLLLAFSAIAFLISAYALLCYKNQRIHVLSETEFQYTTFLGKKKIYKFEDIVSIKFNPDSHTLVMKKGRILIESSAHISERLKLLFNKELDRVYKANHTKRHH